MNLLWVECDLDKPCDCAPKDWTLNAWLIGFFLLFVVFPIVGNANCG